MTLTYLLHGSILVSLGFLSWYPIGKSIKPTPFLLAFLTKMIAALLVGYMYKSYYAQGDPLVYFDFVISQERSLSFFTKEFSEWGYQPRSIFFIKMIAPVVFITQDYWLTGLYLSVFSFAGSVYLMQVLSEKFPYYKWLFFSIILLWPSSLFWSSGLLKESLANPFLFISLASFFQYFWFQNRKWYIFLVFAISTLALVQIRFYLGGILMTYLATLLVFRLSASWPRWQQITSISLVLILGFLMMRLLHPWMTLNRLALTIYETHQQIVEKSPATSLSNISLDPTYMSLIARFPEAIFTSLFRPFIWEHPVMISLPERIENLILLVMTGITVFFWKRIKWSQFVIVSIAFIFVLAGFLALSTPNFGTLSRYSSSFLPLYALLVSVIPFQLLIERVKP